MQKEILEESNNENIDILDIEENINEDEELVNDIDKFKISYEID
jgi:hypothetical protein